MSEGYPGAGPDRPAVSPEETPPYEEAPPALAGSEAPASAEPVQELPPPAATEVVETAAQRIEREQQEVSDRLANRPRPPLTEKDIEKLERHRGKFVSQAEIDGMNEARARGIHTSIV